MKLDMRYGHHPEDVKHYDTEALRRHFLVEKVFVTGELTLVYTHVDRVVFGGAVPTTQALSLQGGKEFGTPNFLDRRELGVVNLGEPGRVLIDGKDVAVYRGHAILPVAIAPLQPEGDIRIGLRLSYAVCGEVCRPGYAVHSISILAAPTPVTAGAAEQAERIAEALARAESGE